MYRLETVTQRIPGRRTFETDTMLNGIPIVYMNAERVVESVWWLGIRNNDWRKWSFNHVGRVSLQTRTSLKFDDCCCHKY